MVMMRSEGTHLLYTCIINIIGIIRQEPGWLQNPHQQHDHHLHPHQHENHQEHRAHLDKSLNCRSTLITLFSTNKDSIRTFQVLCIWRRSLQIINHLHYHYRSRHSKSSAFFDSHCKYGIDRHSHHQYYGCTSNN